MTRQEGPEELSHPTGLALRDESKTIRQHQHRHENSQVDRSAGRVIWLVSNPHPIGSRVPYGHQQRQHDRVVHEVEAE